MIVKANAAFLAVYDLRAVGLLVGFLILEEGQEAQALPLASYPTIDTVTTRAFDPGDVPL
jgi:hypothetical protein